MAQTIAGLSTTMTYYIGAYEEVSITSGVTTTTSTGLMLEAAVGFGAAWAVNNIPEASQFVSNAAVSVVANACNFFGL